MKSPVVKRSIVVGGHKTSVSLEDAFWHSLKEIARVRRETLCNLVGDIDHQRSQGNLSSTLRLFVLDHYRTQSPTASPDHNGAGTAMAEAAAERRSLPPESARAWSSSSRS